MSWCFQTTAWAAARCCATASRRVVKSLRTPAGDRRRGSRSPAAWCSLPSGSCRASRPTPTPATNGRGQGPGRQRPGRSLCLSGKGELGGRRRRRAAVISSRPDGDARSWAYHIEDADPLEYAEVQSRCGSRAPPSSFRRALVSRDGRRSVPDALFRVATGFELVQNPASVLCSVADGYLLRIEVGQLRRPLFGR